MISVLHNMAAMNAQRQFGINNKKQSTNMERLSSGFKVNRAADDAAGLAISEKLRRQIRGLNQGSRNAQDGISWVQIGDGALNEVHDMLHRMTELTTQSLNDTYTAQDRAYMEEEFNELQSQIDNITKHTKFNEQHIFSDHEPTYYQVQGNAVWPHDQQHNVFSPDNTLIVSYRENDDDDPVSVTITVPEGTYTTQELADEIEDAIADSPLAADPRLNFEFTEDGTFNANLEGGARIESVDGGLSSLLYKTYQGGSVGALIGTTIFPSDSSRLRITAGKNDNMTFTIENFSGGTSTKSLTLSPGSYTRDELIDLLNNKLAGTTVTAIKHGTGIMLSSDDSIISHFKGNMFQIDGASYTSVFYDNVYHGEVSLTPGTFTGGAVLPTSSYANGRDVEHRAFEIKSGVNDQLTFAPNGSDTPVTITIPEGRYEMAEMVTKLNSLFQSNGLGLTATSYNSSTYSGIKITSKLQGATSDVGLASDSSAFNTLFVERKYNVYSIGSTVTNEGTPDRNAYVLGGKSFTNSTYDNLPLRIDAGVNDTFGLNIDGTVYSITLDAGTYTSADGIKNAVNTALARTNLGDNTGKIAATVDGGKIKLTADSSASIINLNVQAVSGNNGYNELFRTSYKIEENTLSGSNMRLDRVFPDPTTISDSDKYITVESLDGLASYRIELPTGDNITHDQIKEAIESQTGATTYTDISNSPSYADGVDNNFTLSNYGQTNTTYHSYESTGVTVMGGIEGQVGEFYTTNTPAKVTIPVGSSFTTTADSNKLQITLNNRTETLEFDIKTYTPSTFAAALQQKINATFGTVYGGATVQASGNNIIITSRLKDVNGVEQPASGTNIKCNTNTSSLLREINTTRYAAEITAPSNRRLPTSGINVSAGDTFEFDLNGVKQTVNLTELTNASGGQFVNMLNNCLSAQNIPVTAYYTSGRLTLTTQNKGSGNSLAYNSADGGTVSSVLYGDLKTAGKATCNAATKTNITIESDKTAFRYSLNGVQKTINLTPGDNYTRASLVDELNSKLEGVTASIDSSGRLVLTTDSKGSGSTIRIPYDSSADSAMRAIWGQVEHKAPALTASFDDTNRLKLRSADGTQFRLRSSQTGLVDPKRNPYNTDPSQGTGYHSTKHATLDGMNLNISSANPLTIDKWNDDLSFNYFKDGARNAVSINVAHGTYTSYEELKNELQSKIDSAVGSGEITVTVDEHGVVIKADKAGSTRTIGSSGYTSLVTNPMIFGDFFDKVMNTASETTSRQSTSKTVGSNVANTNKLPYTTGRRNVKDNPVKIKEGINDALSLDFTYTDANGRIQNRTYNMTLDAGTFQGNSLARMVQEKLNEQLRADGLAENLIEVGIGGTNAVVAGVDNDKVLTFKLSNSLPLPSGGEYVIDGLGGNAAFSIFYQTTGDLEPAYIEGAKDITKGVEIEEDHNVLNFSTDGNSYSIEIPPGKYSRDEILSTLNNLLTSQNAPIKAEMSDEGKLRFAHKKMGNHSISNLSGPARGSLFFNEMGGQGEDHSVTLQLSSEVKDTKDLDRPPMSTSFLGINTITITRPKYAEKAMTRLKEALTKVSQVRSYFGAMQNALEHAVNLNNNTAENTEAAESRIRDTDMAATVVSQATQNILMQAGMSMISQANQDRQFILDLLK